MKLTYDRARSLLCYDAASGSLRWLSSNREAGSVNKDLRVKVKVDGRPYWAHRIAWLLSCGSWPTGVIDHINGNPSDNRLCNIRDVDRSINSQNRRKASKSNKAGMLGVTEKQYGYEARIKTSGLVRVIGTFASAQEAHAAYIGVKREVHDGCTI